MDLVFLIRVRDWERKLLKLLVQLRFNTSPVVLVHLILLDTARIAVLQTFAFPNVFLGGIFPRWDSSCFDTLVNPFQFLV